jgi:hypothetical protein
MVLVRVADGSVGHPMVMRCVTDWSVGHPVVLVWMANGPVCTIGSWNGVKMVQ